MLRAIILVIVIGIFCVGYRDILFSRRPLLVKLKIIPVPAAIFAFAVLITVNGFRGEPEAPIKLPVEEGTPATTASIAPVPPAVIKPLSSQEAAAACIESAMKEAEATDDDVAKTWMSSVEGYIDSTPGEITVQFAVGPQSISTRGPQCRSEARLTCSIKGSDVSPVSPIQMTGARLAC